jgi:O-acetyl-ADP-ribose deacetylase (regulator of RNase III)
MKLIKDGFSGKKIGLPFIGAGLAGGDWAIISQIIKEELAGEDITVVVWEKSRDKWQLDLLNS